MAEDTDAKEKDSETGEHTAPYPPPTPARPQAWSDTDEPVVDRPDPVEPLVADPEPELSEPQPIPVDTSTVVIEKPPEPDKPNLIKPPVDAPEVDVPPAQPVVVPGTMHHLRRWVLLSALLGTWIPAAAAGIAVYQWWYDSADPTLPLFVVAVYVVATTVVSLLLAMVEHKPWVSAVAVALLTAPFASTAAAAALHGAHAFGWA